MERLAEIGPELVRVARLAIRSQLTEGRVPAVGRPGAPAAGVFVTLRNPDGSLRGCIGSISPIEADVVAETARSAVLAATRDPRFDPVSPDELGSLSIEVSVLEPEEPAAGLADLDPAIYGVIVRDQRGRRGLLLPDIDGVDDAATQVEIARRKAGISADEPIILSRFRVSKFAE